MKDADKSKKELIDELNLLRARLQKTEQYRDFFENANDAIFLVDACQNYVDVNKKAAELFGYTRRELAGRCIFDFIPEDQKPRSAEEFRKLKHVGKYEKFRGRMRARDGHWVDIEVSSSAIFDGRTYLGSQDIVRDITDQVRAEQSLRESEARLNEAQQVAHIGHWVWFPGSGDLFWSRETYRIIGLPPETVPTLQIFLDHSHPDDREFVHNSIQEALEKRKPFNIDSRVTRPDGSARTVNSRGTVEYDASGRPVRMFGTILDITDRVQAEKTLRESEEKFRTIFDAANDGILIVNRTSRAIIKANKTFSAMLGFTAAELRGMNLADIHPAGDLDRVLAEFDAHVRKGNAISLDIPVRRKDGGVFYADISITTILLNGEQCALGVFRDITERKRAEEALRKSEQYVRTILDTVDEGFIVVDRDYRIETANRAYCSQIGKTREEVLHKHCYEVSHGKKRPCHEEGEECAVRYAFVTGKPYTAVHRHRDASGALLFMETKAFPIKDAAGSVISAIETVNNITEKHLLEEVRLKTQKLEAIGTLAGGIAHDFNNLLQAVFGYISLSKMEVEANGRPLPMLDQAEHALNLCVNLTKQLLTFSKGGLPEKKMLSLPAIIEDATKFALSGSSIGYRLMIDPDIKMVEADEGQISQVIQNIVINAEQAMPREGAILISAKNVRLPRKRKDTLFEEGSYVEIAIEDSGMGIPDQNLTRIFDPYFTTKKTGSGLGLATAYSIVKNHGGMINVRSQVGKGSTFFVHLPASDTASLPAGAKDRVAPLPRPAKILLMDDEELIREIAGQMMKRDGHHVEFAEHGEAAIEKYRSARESGAPFDMVILDLTIRGGMGGRETVERLREIDPALKAIVSSGYSDDAVIAEHARHGFAARLTKPYKISELRNAINTVLLQPGNGAR